MNPFSGTVFLRDISFLGSCLKASVKALGHLILSNRMSVKMQIHRLCCSSAELELWVSNLRLCVLAHTRLPTIVPPSSVRLVTQLLALVCLLSQFVSSKLMNWIQPPCWHSVPMINLRWCGF